MTTETTTDTQDTKVYLATYNEFMSALNKAVDLGLEIDTSEQVELGDGGLTVEAIAFGVTAIRGGSRTFLLYVRTGQQAEEYKALILRVAFRTIDEVMVSRDYQTYGIEQLRKYIDIRTAELETPF